MGLCEDLSVKAHLNVYSSLVTELLCRSLLAVKFLDWPCLLQYIL